MAKNTKDFSIFLTKVSTDNATKDFSVVTGYNMLVQQIEQACKVNKGELMADPYFGSDINQFLYSDQINKNFIQGFLSNSINYGVTDVNNVVVKNMNYGESSLTFEVEFSVSNSVNSQSVKCNIEVPL